MTYIVESTTRSALLLCIVTSILGTWFVLYGALLRFRDKRDPLVKAAEARRVRGSLMSLRSAVRLGSISVITGFAVWLLVAGLNFLAHHLSWLRASVDEPPARTALLCALVVLLGGFMLGLAAFIFPELQSKQTREPQHNPGA